MCSLTIFTFGLPFAFVAILTSISAHSLEQIRHLKEAGTGAVIAKPPSSIPHEFLFQPKIEEDYEPRGRMTFVPELNLTVYDTVLDDSGNSSVPERLLILGCDIFGYHVNFAQIADLIAAGKNQTGSFRVLIPDLYHGGWPVDDFPPANETAFMDYVTNNVVWETSNVKTDLQNVIAHYNSSSGNTTGGVGVFGFCAGGGLSVRAGQELNGISGVGLIHPSIIVTEDALTLKSPALLLPASDDLDMDEFEAILMDQMGIDAVFHRRFTDMTHGFSGAIGNWSNPLVRQRVDQVISLSIDFFDKHM